jgi:hypothetical protein
MQYAPGIRFGRLTLIGKTKRNGRSAWSCQCECGNSIEALQDNLGGGKTRSCGCLSKERRSEVHSLGPNISRCIDEETIALLLREDMEVLVDLEDYESVKGYHWTPSRSHDGKRVYVVSRTGEKIIQLHQLVMAPFMGGKKIDIDHQNHNGLDNRKSNLRMLTRQQNMENRPGPNRNSSTGIRGVSVSKRGVYVAQVKSNYRNYCAGTFPLTSEGLRDAEAAVIRLREKLHTHSDGR